MFEIDDLNKLADKLDRQEYLYFLSIRAFSKNHLVEMYGQDFVDAYESVKAQLNASRFSPNNINASGRVINHWIEKGLLSDPRPKGSKAWRKFSFLDLVWVNILEELRKYGMPLDALKKAKEETVRGVPGMPNIFASYLLFSLIGHPLYLFVSHDGKTEFSTYPCQSNFDGTSSITIRVHRILDELLSKKQDYKSLEQTQRELSKKDKELLELINAPNWKQIIISNTNSDTVHCEVIHEANTKKSLHEILEAVEYGDVKIKRYKGKNAHTEVRESKKIRR